MCCSTIRIPILLPLLWVWTSRHVMRAVFPVDALWVRAAVPVHYPSHELAPILLFLGVLLPSIRLVPILQDQKRKNQLYSNLRTIKSVSLNKLLILNMEKPITSITFREFMLLLLLLQLPHLLPPVVSIIHVLERRAYPQIIILVLS